MLVPGIWGRTLGRGRSPRNTSMATFRSRCSPPLVWWPWSLLAPLSLWSFSFGGGDGVISCGSSPGQPTGAWWSDSRRPVGSWCLHATIVPFPVFWTRSSAEESRNPLIHRSKRRTLAPPIRCSAFFGCGSRRLHVDRERTLALLNGHNPAALLRLQERTVEEHLGAQVDGYAIDLRQGLRVQMQREAVPGVVSG